MVSLEWFCKRLLCREARLRHPAPSQDKDRPGLRQKTRRHVADFRWDRAECPISASRSLKARTEAGHVWRVHCSVAAQRQFKNCHRKEQQDVGGLVRTRRLQVVLWERSSNSACSLTIAEPPSRWLSGSPAIDSGMHVAGVDTDHSGAPQQFGSTSTQRCIRIRLGSSSGIWPLELSGPAGSMSVCRNPPTSRYGATWLQTQLTVKTSF